MSTIRVFENFNIQASVSLAGQIEDYLEVSGNGVVAAPVRPKGFHLAVLLPKEGRWVVTQKDLSAKRGSYGKKTLAEFNQIEDFFAYMTKEPIEVRQGGQDVWTNWKSPNHLDCYRIEEDGLLTLFQLGIIMRKAWLLHGEIRWQGCLYQDGKNVVARPNNPLWGSMDSRRKIFDLPEFKEILKRINLENWTGSNEELNPPLPKLPDQGFARVDWFTIWSGKRGQGMCTCHDGIEAWIHGEEIMNPPDIDGIQRLNPGDIVSYMELVSTNEPNKYKLKYVEKVS